jgi:hypothetical protein
MTKKWKCISITPPDRCTSVAEHVSSPSEVTTVLSRRRGRSAVAIDAKATIRAVSVKLCATVSPRTREKTNSAGTWSHSSVRIDR